MYLIKTRLGFKDLIVSIDLMKTRLGLMMIIIVIAKWKQK